MADEENFETVPESETKDIVEIVKEDVVEKKFKGETYLTSTCKCGNPIKNEKATDGFVTCSKCKTKIKC